MANFTKTDLQYKYSWTTTSGDSKLKGEPDRSLLNWHEGYEVLYMINKLMSAWDFTSVSTGKKIEKMIHATPSNYHSQEHVKSWIHQNWSSY